MPNFEREAKLQAYIFLFPALAGLYIMTLGLSFGPIGLFCITLNVIGFFLFYRSKRAFIERTGIKSAFGPANMTSSEKRKYFIGYALMIFSLSIMFWAVIRLR